jgi:serine/threonine-protein phosphatase 2A regulatory subunit A
MFPILSNLVSDQIPNIRFNVAKSYAVLIDVLKRLPDNDSTVLSLEKTGKVGSGSPQGDHLIRENIMPNLEKLMADDDVDVRFFASQAAKSYNDSMQS